MESIFSSYQQPRKQAALDPDGYKEPFGDSEMIENIKFVEIFKKYYQRLKNVDKALRATAEELGISFRQAVLYYFTQVINQDTILPSEH